MVLMLIRATGTDSRVSQASFPNRHAVAILACTGRRKMVDLVLVAFKYARMYS